VWDSLFSRVSSPNLEWWIWFLAPVVAAAIAAKALYEQRPVPRITVAPAVIFLGFWALLILGGIRRYAKTTDLGPLATVAGLIVLCIVAFMKAPAPIRKPIATRR
jgi:amino acid transporter